MRFEWDEGKRERTVRQRDVDFLRVTKLFDGRPVRTFDTSRGGEERFLTVGEIDERCFAVVWTWRGDAVRIISARRASVGEERAYRELHG